MILNCTKKFQHFFRGLVVKMILDYIFTFKICFSFNKIINNVFKLWKHGYYTCMVSRLKAYLALIFEYKCNQIQDFSLDRH